MSRPQNIYLRVVFYLLNKPFRAPKYDTVICHNCHPLKIFGLCGSENRFLIRYIDREVKK